MAKGWKLVGTNASEFGDTRTRGEKLRYSAKQARMFDKAIRTTEKLSYEKLVEEADKCYEIRQAENAALIQALDDNKLKSKNLIKKAQFLKEKINDEPVATV